MSDIFLRRKSRNALVSLYRDWVREHILLNAKYLCLVAGILMLILMPFDSVIFGSFDPFSIYRCAGIVVSLMLFGLLHSAKKNRLSRYATALLISSPMIFTLMYQYFFAFFDKEHMDVVLVGNIMCVFFSTFVIHRFAVAQHTYTLLSILALILMKSGLHLGDTYFYLLVVTHICSSIIAVYFRREFAGVLFERFNSLKNFVPVKVAKGIVVASNGSQLLQSLAPTNTHVVCLCADWRGFQGMSKAMDPDELSRLMEVYYDTILQALDQTDPSGTYYFNWVADELFLIFFNEQGNLDSARNNALVFCTKLIGEVLQEVQSKTGVNLAIDVGLSDGEGLVGLQGPKFSKKTTITGEVAGRARRFESEAKTLRSQEGSGQNRPRIVMDPILKRTAEKQKLLTAGQWTKIIAKTKDISDREVWLYTETYTESVLVG